MPPRPPTARQSFAHARAFARALGPQGANVIPCSVPERRPLVKWAHLHAPGSPRIAEDCYLEWLAEAERRERAGEPTAWQVLPGSVRCAVLDVDKPEAMPAILERFGDTPLKVFSPTPGRAHLWYRWPPGMDVGSVAETALGGAYAVKARGAAIHAPGSLHRNGTGWYRCSIPAGEWAGADLRDRLPNLDLAALDEDRVGRLDLGALSGLPEEWAGEDEAERRAIAWLRVAGPPLPGEREQKTWRAAMTLGDLGVREPQAVRLIVAWDSESMVPRGPVEAADTVTRAYERRRLPGGCRRVAHGGDIDADSILADLNPGGAL